MPRTVSSCRALLIPMSEALMEEALDLTRRGSVVDIDTVEGDLPKLLCFYLDRGGDPGHLTASSDASISSPRTLYEQIRACVRDYGFPLEQVLSLVTRNTARVLKLESKGHLNVGKDADVLVLRKDSLEIVDVLARGLRMVRDGQLVVTEEFLEGSNRSITLEGKSNRRQIREMEIRN